MISRQVKVNEIVLMDCKRLNEQFVHDAVKQWDLDGQGCFLCWVMAKATLRWLEMVRCN